MAEEFIRNRLQQISKENLIKIITSPRNAALFKGFRVKDLESKSKPDLVNLIMSQPTAVLDNNVQADFRHQAQAQAFDKIYDAALKSGIYNPNTWKAKPHQVDHIKRLVAGLLDPVNEARSVHDGSLMGRGKTISAILAAIQLKVRFLLIIGPDSVVKKWHDSLAPLGLFIYRICTYAGIKGTDNRADVQWAKHKADPDRLNKSEDMNWVQIRKTGLTGINDKVYDWSFLPDFDPNTGAGGCLVIWDEIQNAKNVSGSKQAKNFNDFIKYLHSEPKKYIRGLFLSGTVIESPSDLAYIMHALGYISDSTQSKLNLFKNTELLNNFRQWIGSDWKPEYENIDDSNIKLILFIRIVGGRQNKFSEIPDPLVYIVHRLGLIQTSTMEKFVEFRDKILLPKFREAMEQDWRPELDELDSQKKIKAFLRHLSRNPKYKDMEIDRVLDGIFENPITFQGLQIQTSDIGEFIRINREIEALLLDIAHGNKKFDGGLLGQIQRTLSELEVLKLTPFTQLAKIALTTQLPGGAKGSVVISMLRNSSVRYFAWRLEAFLFVEFLKTLNLSAQKIAEIRIKVIDEILREYEQYIKDEEYAIRNGKPLKLKKQFARYPKEQLSNMSMEDLINEYNKWVKYLDVSKFEYVCIFVSDFGNPNPTEFDLESPDENDWVKESKPLTRQVKEDMKDLFQSNKRRVFLTNIQISREGIDLHDISPGGKHPRTGIISPGLVARYFIQMLGRFVREGQSSETLRIIGYIDNIQGIQSWEAKFMEKLSEKVKYIQLLQTGEISLDILDNIDKDGNSLVKEIVNDIRRGAGFQLGEDGEADIPAKLPVPIVLGEQVSAKGRTSAPGKISILREEDRPMLVPVTTSNAVGEYLKKTFGVKNPVVGGLLPQEAHDVQVPGVPQPIHIQPRNPNLIMKTNEKYLFFSTQDQLSSDTIHRLIVENLNKIMLDSKYYKVFHDNSGLPSGVLIYRQGFLIGSLSQTSFVSRLEIDLGMKIINQPVGEDAFNSYQFVPVVAVKNLQIVPESATSILIGPPFPTLNFLPKSLISKGLTVETVNEFASRLKGPTPIVMLAFYTLRAIALVSNSDTFKNLTILDPNKVFDKLDQIYKVKNIIKDGKYQIFGSKYIIRLFPVVLGVQASYVVPLTKKEVLDEYIEDSNGLGILTVKAPYQDVVTKILGTEPEDLAKKI